MDEKKYKSAYCEEVIITNLLRRGGGTSYDPLRIVTQIFRKDGEMIAESDPVADSDSFTGKNMISFANWSKRYYPEDKLTTEHIGKWREWMKEDGLLQELRS